MSEQSVAFALRYAQQQLAATDSPQLEASLLLCHLLGWRSSKLISHSDEQLSAEQLAQLQQLIERRKSGEPSAYIIGQRAFWTLDLQVSPDTLIPRPDTETLVEQALALIADKPAARVLDMGTGSGAIALAIASERPDAHVEASDFSAAALAMAKHNAQQCQINIQAWHHGSWFEALPAQTAAFDLIVSNPPYIASDDPHLPSLQHEPLSALVAGADGLDDIRLLIEQAPNYLNADGQLALEHGYDQAAAVAQLFATAGYTQLQQQQDLAQIIRASAATTPGSSHAHT